MSQAVEETWTGPSYSPHEGQPDGITTEGVFQPADDEERGEACVVHDDPQKPRVVAFNVSSRTAHAMAAILNVGLANGGPQERSAREVFERAIGQVKR